MRQRCVVTDVFVLHRAALTHLSACPVTPAGPNSCGATGQQCVVDYATCYTGMAGGSPTPHFFYCADATPSGSLHNAVGMLCFDTLSNCAAAPNACTLENPCEFGISECQTGAATQAALGHALVCPTSIADGAVYNGGGCGRVEPRKQKRLIAHPSARAPAAPPSLARVLASLTVFICVMAALPQ